MFDSMTRDPRPLKEKLEELSDLEERHRLLGTSVQTKNFRDGQSLGTAGSIDYVLAVTRRAAS